MAGFGAHDPVERGPGPRRAFVGRSAELELVLAGMEQGRAVVIGGEAGVGKTALLDVAIAELGRRGFRCLRVQPTPGVSALPLGALSHLVPSSHGLGTSAAAAEATAVLGAFGPGAVLCVDDLPFLDPVSEHVILQALADGRLRLLGTARTEHALADQIRSAVAAHGRHLDLVRLSLAETASLVEALVGGGVHRATAQRIHESTDGLPLAVTELVRHALDRGLLTERDGLYAWRRSGTIDVRLATLLGARADSLVGADRDAVEMLCIAEHLPMQVLRAASGGFDVRSLEQDRWIRSSGRAGWVTPGHALLRDAVAAQLTPLHHHELIDRLLVAMNAAPDDVELRRRRMNLACRIGAPVDRDELLGVVAWARANSQGRHMLALVERAWIDHSDAFTGLAYGDALVQLRRYEEAAAVYEAAASHVRDPETLVELAITHAHALRHGLGELAAATDLLERARRSLGSPLHRAQLAASEAEDALLLGRCAHVISMWNETEFAPTADTAELRYRLTQSAVAALLYAGQVEDAESAYAEHRRLAAEFGGRHPLVSIYTDGRRRSTLVLAGCGSRIRADNERLYQDAVANGDAPMLPLYALPVGMDAWLRDLLGEAERLAREAMAVPLDEVRQIAAYLVVRVMRLQGRHQEIPTLCEQVLAENGPATTINLSWVTGAQANARAALARRPDEREAAVAEAFAEAQRTMALGQRVPSAYMFHDLLPFGWADRVTGPLAELAAVCDAPVVALMADHARGLAERDDDLLRSTAERAETLGCELFARLIRSDLGATGGPRPAAVGLTPKELEVALAAASGMTDKEIAAHLTIAVRTVNAHLRSVYAKLGVPGRRQLRGALGPHVAG